MFIFNDVHERPKDKDFFVFVNYSKHAEDTAVPNILFSGAMQVYHGEMQVYHGVLLIKSVDTCRHEAYFLIRQVIIVLLEQYTKN